MFVLECFSRFVMCTNVKGGLILNGSPLNITVLRNVANLISATLY